MAMTLRLDGAVDARLERLAAQKRTSKSALVAQAVEELLRSEERRTELDSGLAFVLEHDADLLRRLEDA